jgi:hypothetical protein
MPLSDREQRILAEIERQFYQNDPELAHAVRNINRSARIGVRLPLIGVLAGLATIVFTFTRYTLAALAGFILVVVSATLLAHVVRARGFGSRGDSDDTARSAKRRFGPFGRG